MRQTIYTYNHLELEFNLLTNNLLNIGVDRITGSASSFGIVMATTSTKTGQNIENDVTRGNNNVITASCLSFLDDLSDAIHYLKGAILVVIFPWSCTGALSGERGSTKAALDTSG